MFKKNVCQLKKNTCMKLETGIGDMKTRNHSVNDQRLGNHQLVADLWEK